MPKASTTKQAKRSNTEMPIDDIVIGERNRSELGDIAGLAASIADIGLLNPISVDERGQLLAGRRRLAACKLLGLKQVEVRIIRENVR
jgi:ParB family transcriptional regulator, chromosome partitioning protein